jgi:hypothetical protein
LLLQYGSSLGEKGMGPVQVLPLNLGSCNSGCSGRIEGGVTKLGHERGRGDEGAIL